MRVKAIRIISTIVIASSLASCAAPKEQAGTPAPSVPVSSATASAAPVMMNSPLPLPSLDDAQFDAYSSARRQITNNYSEHVSNYTRTFGSDDSVKLPSGGNDPYLSIRVPMLVGANQGIMGEILNAPLEFATGEDSIGAAYLRLYAALEPFKTAYETAQRYYLDGGADADNYAKAQELHTAAITAAREYNSALSAFSTQMRAHEKRRRVERLQRYLDRGQNVRYQVESVREYGGDIEDFLSDFDDENPYYNGDAEAFRKLRDDFAVHADAVLAFTSDDLIKEGFNEAHSHMFPHFFAAIQKMRLIADNILTIMEAKDMAAPLPTLPPNADNSGMDPVEAIESFEENFSIATKLYSAFTADAD